MRFSRFLMRRPTSLDIIVLALIVLTFVVVLEGWVIRNQSVRSRHTLAVLICQQGNTSASLADLGFDPAQIARQLRREAMGRDSLLRVLGEHNTCTQIRRTR